MLYILSTYPEHADMMNFYERIELDEVFGEYDASQLENGIAVFANGGIHVNALHAAKREADDFLMNGGVVMTPRTDSDALLPCPFCGGDAELMADHDNAWANCPECQISLEGFETETDAIAAWNTRAEAEALRKERDALNRALSSFTDAVEKDIIRVRPSERDHLMMILAEANVALTGAAS